MIIKPVDCNTISIVVPSTDAGHADLEIFIHDMGAVRPTVRIGNGEK